MILVVGKRQDQYIVKKDIAALTLENATLALTKKVPPNIKILFRALEGEKRREVFCGMAFCCQSISCQMLFLNARDKVLSGNSFHMSFLPYELLYVSGYG